MAHTAGVGNIYPAHKQRQMAEQGWWGTRAAVLEAGAAA